jgi:hypothetical protein
MRRGMCVGVVETCPGHLDVLEELVLLLLL